MKRFTLPILMAVAVLVSSCMTAPKVIAPENDTLLETTTIPEEEIEPSPLEPVQEEAPVLSRAYDVQSWPTERPVDEDEPKEAVDHGEEEVESSVPQETQSDETMDTAPQSDAPVMGVNLGDCAVLGGTYLPKWFVYSAEGLILALLIAICFIARQIRLSHRRRD